MEKKFNNPIQHFIEYKKQIIRIYRPNIAFDNWNAQIVLTPAQVDEWYGCLRNKHVITVRPMFWCELGNKTKCLEVLFNGLCDRPRQSRATQYIPFAVPVTLEYISAECCEIIDLLRGESK